MKRRLLLIFVLGLLLVTFSTAYAGSGSNDSHKIRTKWNLKGSFISERDPETPGQTWKYNYQVKEAMDGDYSSGVIKFKSGDNVITAHVEATKTNYHYWTRTGSPLISTNLASVGWAEYNGEKYNFMSLYAKGWIWIILSHDDYSDEWSVGDVYQGSEREYQLLSLGYPSPNYSYDFDPHVIH